jgi:hypothetical protein
MQVKRLMDVSVNEQAVTVTPQTTRIVQQVQHQHCVSTLY